MLLLAINMMTDDGT